MDELEKRDYKVSADGLSKTKRLLRAQKEIFDRANKKSDQVKSLEISQTPTHSPYESFIDVNDDILCNDSARPTVVIRHFTVLPDTIGFNVLMKQNEHRKPTVYYVLQRLCDLLENYRILLAAVYVDQVERLVRIAPFTAFTTADLMACFSQFEVWQRVRLMD